jgi:hypothetical protein
VPNLVKGIGWEQVPDTKVHFCEQFAFAPENAESYAAREISFDSLLNICFALVEPGGPA